MTSIKNIAGTKPKDTPTWCLLGSGPGEDIEWTSWSADRFKPGLGESIIYADRIMAIALTKTDDDQTLKKACDFLRELSTNDPATYQILLNYKWHGTVQEIANRISDMPCGSRKPLRTNRPADTQALARYVIRPEFTFDDLLALAMNGVDRLRNLNSMIRAVHNGELD